MPPCLVCHLLAIVLSDLGARELLELFVCDSLSSGGEILFLILLAQIGKGRRNSYNQHARWQDPERVCQESPFGGANGRKNKEIDKIERVERSLSCKGDQYDRNRTRHIGKHLIDKLAWMGSQYISASKRKRQNQEKASDGINEDQPARPISKQDQARDEEAIEDKKAKEKDLGLPGILLKHLVCIASEPDVGS